MYEFNNGRTPLTLEQVRQVAPSVFAPSKHESRSERYAYIPTAEPLEMLMDEGYLPVKAMQSHCRDMEQAPFTKHMLRLRRAQDVERVAVLGETVTDILLTNAHDGTSAYIFRLGCFRFVCLNGMVVGDNSMTLKVYHKGNPEVIKHKVIEAAYEVTGLFDKVNESKELMKSRVIGLGHQLDFADRALELRYGDKEPTITRSDVLLARRLEDTGDSVWSVFQRVQENLLNGGLRPSVRGKRRTRAVTNIDTNIRLNKGLWNLALEYAS